MRVTQNTLCDDTDDTGDLEPCPLCGAEMETETIWERDMMLWRSYCSACDLEEISG